MYKSLCAEDISDEHVYHVRAEPTIAILSSSPQALYANFSIWKVSEALIFRTENVCSSRHPFPQFNVSLASPLIYIAS